MNESFVFIVSAIFFNDFMNEVQRSFGFCGFHHSAKIRRFKKIYIMFEDIHANQGLKNINSNADNADSTDNRG